MNVRIGMFTLALLAACGGTSARPPAEGGSETGATGATETSAGGGSTSEATTGVSDTSPVSASAGPSSTDEPATGTGEDSADPSSSSTTSGSTGSADDSTSTGLGEPVPCDVAEATLPPVSPNIMLVLDKSGSMVSNTWDHDGAPTPEVTRWNSLYTVVDFIVSAFEDEINFGASLFPAVTATPTYDADACVVSDEPEISVAGGNAATLLAGIPGPNATALYGGTPAAAAISVARDHLVSLGSDEPRGIIFVTDGAANCAAGSVPPALFEAYDDDLADVVGAAWTDDQIPTWVVGIDISSSISPVVADGNPDGINPVDELNAVAVAGGQPLAGAVNFYQTTNEAQLQGALQSIIDEALSCTVALVPVPAFPDLMVVVVDGSEVPRVDDCGTEDGWMFTNPAGPYDTIALCGSWCETLKDTGTVTAEFYCLPG